MRMAYFSRSGEAYSIFTLSPAPEVLLLPEEPASMVPVSFTGLREIFSKNSGEPGFFAACCAVVEGEAEVDDDFIVLQLPPITRIAAK